MLFFSSCAPRILIFIIANNRLCLCLDRLFLVDLDLDLDFNLDFKMRCDEKMGSLTIFLSFLASTAGPGTLLTAVDF